MHSFPQFTRSTLWGGEGRICLSVGNHFRGKLYGEGAIFRGQYSSEVNILEPDIATAPSCLKNQGGVLYFDQNFEKK